MAHFALLWKARAVEKRRLDYEKEKLKSVSLAEVELPRKKLSEKWQRYRSATSARVSRTFSRWFPHNSAIYNCIIYLKTDQTLPTFLLKSTIGFAVGIVLTYLCFMFFVFQLSISLMVATIFSSVIGVLLTLGLAFSYRIRCLIFLLIPQLFSRVGRYTLTCYALVLILTGPATNTLKNSEILSESMACSQEQIKTNVRQINESHKNPYNSIKDSLKIIMEKFEEISKQLTNGVLKINRLVLSIVSSMQANFNWLKSIVANCNRKFGAPYHYCIRLLNEGVKDCKDVLGLNYYWLCDVNNVAQSACGEMKKYEAFFGVSDVIEDSIQDTVKKKLKNFSDRVASLLYIELHVHYSYSFSSNASWSASQVAAGIVTEIRNRADPLLTWLSMSSCVTSFFLLLIIFRAKNYQQMYDTRSRFDNRYITQELRDLDFKRLREGRETILPLTRRERTKYVTTTSFRLVPSEKVHLNRSAVFMTITSFKLLIHIVADYSLYWVLMIIRYHGHLQSPVEDELPNISVNVSGTTFAARLLRSLINTLKIPLKSSDASITSCLPNPYPPDLRRYMQIGVLIFLLWFFALFEPYGLRLRHVIMGRYRPERAKTRACWLYNHILRSRGGFMKFARRKLHREYKYTTEAHLTFRKWITSHIPCFKFFSCLFGICVEEDHCLLCETKEYSDDTDTELISSNSCPQHFAFPENCQDKYLSPKVREKLPVERLYHNTNQCKSKNCQGIYCFRCFSDIGQLCTICLSPKDYGDLSDVSLEKGSSEDSSDNDDIDDQTGLKSKDKFSKTGINDQDTDKYFKQEYKQKKHWKLFTKSDGDEDKTPLLPYNDYKTENMAMIIYDKLKNNDIGAVNAILLTEDLEEDNHFWYTLCNYGNIIKDFANTSVSTTLLEPFVQYSFYKIKKIHNTVAVTKVERSTVKAKVIQNHFKAIFLSRKQYVEKRNNTLSKIKQKRTLTYFDHGHNNKEQNEVKKNCNEGTFDTRNKNSKNKINENKELIKKCIQLYENDENTISCFGKFSQICFRFWNELKFDLSCTNSANRQRKMLTSSKEMKNYKRRKKRIKINLKKSDYVNRSSLDIDETRKFRMFAYFSDQDWMKTKSELELHNVEFDSNHEIEKPLKGIKSEITNNCKIEEHKRGASIKTNYKNLLQDYNNLANYYPPSQYQNSFDKSHNSTSFSRRINFYRSLGDNEFDDFIYDTVTGNKTTRLNNLEIQSSSAVGEEKGYKLTVKKSNNCLQNKECGTSVAESTAKLLKLFVKGEMLNKKWMHIKIKNPLYALKKLYSSGTEDSSNEKLNKSVAADPSTKSTSCQKYSVKEMAVQIAKDSGEENVIENVFDKNKKCTCATQHSIHHRDVCTWVDNRKEEQINCEHIDKNNTNSSSDVSFAFSDMPSEFSLGSSDTDRTDTTVLSLPTIDYRNERRVKCRRFKVSVVTKTNKSTTTDKAKVCDVSTVTDDWWSPIFERKDIDNGPEKKKQCTLEKKVGSFMMQNVKARKRLKNIGIMTDGKVVTFRSQAQIIPAEIVDILSPSRYLLESQKYYNELFLSKYNGDRVLPVYQFQFDPSKRAMNSKYTTHSKQLLSRDKKNRFKVSKIEDAVRN